MQEITIYPDMFLVNIIAGSLIPLLTALVTKLKADSATKAVSTAVLSVVSAAVAALIADPSAGLPLFSFAFSLFTTFTTAIGTYYGFARPTGLTTKIAEKTADAGLGKPLG